MATPAFGAREIQGIGAILPGNADTARQHREMQRRKMARPRQPGILRASRELQVFIYNVGPFARRMENLGSVGVVSIPGLDEKMVLKGLSVAGPVIREGFPAEPYVGEPRNNWIEHEPESHLKWTDEDGEVFMLNERPGIDEALRIIGGHEQSPQPMYSSSPYQQGCFVSTIPEQKEPAESKEPQQNASREAKRAYGRLLIQYEEEIRSWLKWEASVKAAQLRFTEWAARRGEEQSLAFSNGTYQRDPELFVLARVLGKTVKDWNFLAGTAENNQKKNCHWCGTFMLKDKAKCPQCNEWQPGMKPAEAA